MTGDGPLGHFLHKVTGRKWFNGDTECEGLFILFQEMMGKIIVDMPNYFYKNLKRLSLIFQKLFI